MYFYFMTSYDIEISSQSIPVWKTRTRQLYNVNTMIVVGLAPYI